MRTDYAVALILTSLLVTVFWLLVFLYYTIKNQLSIGEILFAEPPEDINWVDQTRLEIANFEQNRTQAGPDGATVRFEQFGVAENSTNEVQDKAQEDKGDIWLCDGRAFIFMILHALPALLVSLLLVGLARHLFLEKASQNLSLPTHLGIGILTVLLVAFVLGVISFRRVYENERGGVKRIGSQLNGYLKPGLQFVVPLIEEFEPISLKKMIWGPYNPAEDSDVQFIGGIAGSVNPSPGKFQILLARRWGVLVEVAVTMHVARNKNAWYKWLNDYSSVDEIGQQVAVVISAILTRAVGEGTGENQPATTGTGGNQPATTNTGGNQPATPNTASDPEQVMERFNKLANDVPEIASNLLKGLLAIRRRIPVVIESIALTGPIADEELKQWLQVQDESSIEILQQKRVGEASRQRFDQLLQYLKTLDPGLTGGELLKAFQGLNAQEVQRLWAESGKDAGSIESFVRSLLAGNVEKLTQTKTNGKGKGPKQNP